MDEVLEPDETTNWPEASVKIVKVLGWTVVGIIFFGGWRLFDKKE